MDQSLKGQSEKSIIQILNSSTEEMLKSFCDGSLQRDNSPEHSASSALHEEPAIENLETTVNSDLLSI